MAKNLAKLPAEREFIARSIRECDGTFFHPLES
jgi:hypothetical protein